MISNTKNLHLRRNEWSVVTGHRLFRSRAWQFIGSMGRGGYGAFLLYPWANMRQFHMKGVALYFVHIHSLISLLPSLEPLSSFSRLYSRSAPDPLDLYHVPQPGAVMFPPSQPGADELPTSNPRATELPHPAWSRRASAIGAWSSFPALTISAWSCQPPFVQGSGRQTPFYRPGVAELPRLSLIRRAPSNLWILEPCLTTWSCIMFRSLEQPTSFSHSMESTSSVYLDLE